jgi:hypothetical protein
MENELLKTHGINILRRIEESKNRRIEESKNRRIEESKNRRIEESKNRRNVWEVFAMNLKNVADEKLLLDAKHYSKQERELLTVVLYHIKEVERRRLFSTLHYESIFEYAMKDLAYSQDQAGRRVAAARLLEELPEIEEKIKSGALNLTTLGMAQTLFQREKKVTGKPFTSEQKAEVLKNIEQKTTRQADTIVWSFSSVPKPLVKETIKVVSEELAEYNFSATKVTQEKIKKLKGLLAHKNPAISLGELIDKLCDLGLETWDPGQKTVKLRRVAAPRLINSQGKITNSMSEVSGFQAIAFCSRAEISRQVWEKAKSRCENCGSTYALQEDHILPRAKGGASTLNNLRLLCRPCNQRAAIDQFGFKKMASYLS